MDKKIFYLANWLEGGTTPPYTLEIRLTNVCNLKCLSCWHTIPMEKWDYTTELPDEAFVNIAEIAGRIGVKRIEITGGGEPLIKKNAFLKIVELANKFGMEGCLTTNGTLFTEDLIKKIVKFGWSEILLSLDGPDAETHDYLRQKNGCFDKVMNNLKLFNKSKGKFKSSKPQIKFVPVLTNVNFDKLPDFIELAKKFCVHEVRFQPLYTLNEKQEFLCLNENQHKKLSKLIPKTIKLAKKYGIDTNANLFLQDKFKGEKEGSIDIYKKDIERNKGTRENHDEHLRLYKEDLVLYKEDTSQEKKHFLSSPCFLPWFFMSIRPNGAVTPCAAFNEFEHVDNITKNKNLLDVWYGRDFSEFRENLLNHRFHSCCKNCCGGLIINNRGIRGQLECYLKFGHMDFSQIEVFLAEKNKRIQRLDRDKYLLTKGKDEVLHQRDRAFEILKEKEQEITSLRKHVEEFQSSLSFRIVSRASKSSFGKFLKKHLNQK